MLLFNISLPKAVLLTITSMAGLQVPELSIHRITDEQATMLVSNLIQPESRQDLKLLLSTKSVESLSGAERALIAKAIQEATMRIEKHEKPYA